MPTTFVKRPFSPPTFLGGVGTRTPSGIVVPGGFAQVPESVSLLNSLISWWKLDESSGDALDAYGTNTLTDTNTVTAATGKVNGGRQFTAANSEYFTIADNISLSTGDIDFTITAWVMLDSLDAARLIVGKDVDTPANSRDYDLDYQSVTGSTGRFRFYINGSIVAQESTFSPSTGVWYFVCAWHNATANTVNLQRDDGTVASTGTTGTAPQDSGAAFEIGGRAYAGSESYMNGRIDEVGFWKRLLTAAEIAYLYNGGNGRTLAGGRVV